MKLFSVLLASAFLFASLSASAQDPDAPNPAMHSLGAIGAQAVFGNYMAIAELGDLYGAKAYDKEKVVQLANMYAALTTSAKESLNDLIDSGKLNEDDESGVKELVLINDQLLNLSKNIVDYAEDSSDENHAAYEKTRQRAWKTISKFMGIE